jgi:hypothetical protein
MIVASRQASRVGVSGPVRQRESAAAADPVAPSAQSTVIAPT